MSFWRNLVVGMLVLGAVASGLRFYRLGDWSFGNDETATLAEGVALFDAEAFRAKYGVPHTDQIERLAWAIPLSYFVNQVGYEWFGTDEFGCRAMSALIGTLAVPCVFVLLCKPLGLPTAFIAGLLVALWPEHLFHSQNHRFYILAGFCAALTMLLGAQAVQRRSAFLMTLACLAAWAAIATHTLQGLLFAGLLVGVVSATLVTRQPWPGRVLGVIVVFGLIALAFLFFWLLPTLRGWNEGESWGYTPARSLLSAVSLLGWPTVLLAVPGAFILGRKSPELACYWLTFVVLWLGGALVFPMVLTHGAAYVFPQALSVVILAAVFVGDIGEQLAAQSRWLATLMVGACVALNGPAIASHFQDGSRHDYRGAAQYLQQHQQPSDRVVAVSSGILRYYYPSLTTTPLDGVDPLPTLQALTPIQQRTWVVLTTGRSGYPDEVQTWLGQHGRHVRELRRRRFDYYDYRIDIYSLEPSR